MEMRQQALSAAWSSRRWSMMRARISGGSGIDFAREGSCRELGLWAGAGLSSWWCCTACSGAAPRRERGCSQPRRRTREWKCRRSILLRLTRSRAGRGIVCRILSGLIRTLRRHQSKETHRSKRGPLRKPHATGHHDRQPGGIPAGEGDAQSEKRSLLCRAKAGWCRIRMDGIHDDVLDFCCESLRQVGSEARLSSIYPIAGSPHSLQWPVIYHTFITMHY